MLDLFRDFIFKKINMINKVRDFSFNKINMIKNKIKIEKRQIIVQIKGIKMVFF